MGTGIYKIINLVSGKLYVGRSNNVLGRWNGHKYELRHGTHPNIYLQRAWDKYGEDCFRFDVVEYCSDGEVFEREIYWIKTLGSHCSVGGYNLSFGGDGAGCVSDDTKIKLSEAAKRQHARMTPEEKELIGRKIGASNRGRKNSEEVSNKQSEFMRGVWRDNPKWRKPVSPEARARQISAVKNRVISDEERLKRSETALKIVQSLTKEERSLKYGHGWVVRERDSNCVCCGASFVSVKGKNGRWSTRCVDCKGRWKK